MSPYVLVPLGACIAHALLTSTILTRDPQSAANRLAALLVAGPLFWSLCEVLWNVQGDPDTVLCLVKASALGWVAIGPLGLHLLLQVTSEPAALLRRLLPWLYGAALVFLALDWLTPWVHPGVIRTDWGWAYQLGPAYPLFYVFTVASLGAAIWLGARAWRNSPSPSERNQARWIAIGISVPLVVASLTDGLLPFAGVQWPRLGTAAFCVLGATIAWSLHRYGYSLLAPGTFAREIVETLPDGVAMLRLDGRIRTANEGMARLAELPREELPGIRLGELLNLAPVDSPPELSEIECELVTATGRRITVSVSTSSLSDKTGEVIGSVVVVRDLREVVALRQRLVTSGRLAAVGELAAGIAHEINNPIAYVRANLSLLRSHWSEVSTALEKAGARDEMADRLAEGEELLDESLEGVDRAAAFVRDVKGFSHAGRAERELADLNLLLESVLRVAAPQLRERARIERSYADLPLVPCAPQEIKQVLLNLVLNAGQALAESGTIRISTAVDGADVVASVQDDGCGIAPEVLERVFDPFFTTKPVGEGTGLGLAISYQIVRQHGGEIRIVSEVGKGTAASLRLPRGEPAAA